DARLAAVLRPVAAGRRQALPRGAAQPARAMRALGALDAIARAVADVVGRARAGLARGEARVDRARRVAGVGRALLAVVEHVRREILGHLGARAVAHGLLAVARDLVR